MRRFVIDAAALVSGGADPHAESPPSLLFANLGGTRFEAIVCPKLVGEVARGLRKPFFRTRVSADEIEEIVAGIREVAVTSEDPADVEPILRDPADDYLIALARQADAEAIVTSDKDLVDHHGGLEPPAISPRRARELVGLI